MKATSPPKIALIPKKITKGKTINMMHAISIKTRMTQNFKCPSIAPTHISIYDINKASFQFILSMFITSTLV